MTAAEQQDRFSKAEYLRALEKTLAFERAMTAIEGECTAYDDDWFDLGSAEFDLSQEIEYLESRHLLLRRPDHPGWVQICDEEEPLFPSEIASDDVAAQILNATNKTIEDLCHFAKTLAALKRQPSSEIERRAELNPRTELPCTEERGTVSFVEIEAEGSGVGLALDLIGEQLKAFNRGLVRPLRPDLYPPMPKPNNQGETS